MPTVTCNACNAGFDDEEQQRLHYRSEWHRYNLKRKVLSFTFHREVAWPPSYLYRPLGVLGRLGSVFCF